MKVCAKGHTEVCFEQYLYDCPVCARDEIIKRQDELIRVLEERLKANESVS